MSAPRNALQQTLAPLYAYMDSLGQVTSSSVVSGSAVALTSTTAANVTSLTLTEGDWQVFGAIGFLPAASTSITQVGGGSSTTTATMGGLGNQFVQSMAAVVPTAIGQEYSFPTTRISVSAGSTQTVYLVARATFTVSTLGAYGVLNARLITK